MGLFDRFHRKTVEPAPAAPTKATLAPFTRLVIDGDVQVRLIEGAENSIGSDDGDVATLYRYDRDTLFIGGDRESTVIVGGNIINNIHGSCISSITQNGVSTHLNITDVAEGHSLSVSNGQVMIDGQVVSKRGQSISIINGRVMEDGTGMVMQPRSCTIRIPKLPKVEVDAGNLHVQGFAGQAIVYRVAGNGNIRHDDMDTETAILKISGNGAMVLEMKEAGAILQRLDMTLSGNGDIRVRGRAQSADISLAGSGSIHLGDCPVAEARVSLSGSGDIRLNATDSVSGTLSGNAHLALVREPRERQLTVRGCSKVYVINREGTA